MNNDILFIAPGITIRTLVVGRPRAKAIEEREVMPAEDPASHEPTNVDRDGE